MLTRGGGSWHAHLGPDPEETTVALFFQSEDAVSCGIAWMLFTGLRTFRWIPPLLFYVSSMNGAGFVECFPLHSLKHRFSFILLILCLTLLGSAC